MMAQSHPFQKLCYVKASSQLPEVLLAATGSYVCCFDFQKGLVARWPSDNEDGGSDFEETTNGNDVNDGGRPAKRQKISGNDSSEFSRENSEESIEIISERVKGQRRKPKPVGQVKPPDVSHILATDNGKFVIIVTADDKCVRVLERRKSGRLRGLSERCMPKRLCTIALTEDQKTMIAGDKFGDVYSLPLFPSVENVHPAEYRYERAKEPGDDFKPSASELTVHTKGNLEALRQQQQQKKLKPRKEGPTFEHKLLLGHVSLLTDLALSEIKSENSRRQYILTADRDEHIRVSRGISQAHVIENYCLGHKDFVSKLCILPWRPEILVSGGGEPSIKVYDWRGGLCSEDLINSTKVLDEITNDIKASGKDRPCDRLAVSGIWTFSVSDSQGYLLVAFEGLPLLQTLYHDGSSFTTIPTLQLPGNALDITVLEGQKLIAVSIDTYHDSYSMKTRRDHPLTLHESILFFELEDALHSPVKNDGSRPGWRPSTFSADTSLLRSSQPAMAEVPPEEEAPKQQKPHAVYSKLGEFLYGLENLRKQRAEQGAIEGVDENPIADGSGTAEAEELLE